MSTFRADGLVEESVELIRIAFRRVSGRRILAGQRVVFCEQAFAADKKAEKHRHRLDSGGICPNLPHDSWFLRGGDSTDFAKKDSQFQKKRVSSEP